MLSPVREKMTTIGEGGRRFWLYPAKFKGRLLKYRRFLAVFLILFYFLLPWTEINGHQTVLLDVAERKFAIFGIIFWAQDLLIFWYFLVGAVILIFLITAWWGRMWCGWACPQTVFLEHVFRRIEIWIEGDAPKRRRLDAAPMSWEKFWKKSLKFLIFLIVSSHFANTALCYFVGTDQVLEMTFTSPDENLSWFALMAFVNAVFFINFAWFREQFCLIACPYGRFQAVLLDTDSQIVGYDLRRGEPRAILRKNEQRQAGDCIDCSRCVTVCPTGIDIRQGLQMECINCTACIDACDAVMTRIGKPERLIGYTSIAALEDRDRQMIRPRTVIYSLLFVGLWATGFFMLGHKSDVIIRMIRPAGVSFTLEGDNAIISNHFQAKASNKSERTIILSFRAPEGYQLVAALDPWVLTPQQTLQNQLFIRKKKDDFSPRGREKLAIKFFEGEKLISTANITLMGPKQ